MIAVYYEFYRIRKRIMSEKYGAFMRNRSTAKSDYQHLHACLSAWNNYLPTEQIFVKFGEI
jgi:hypothetical protein